MEKNQPEIIILDDCSTVSGNGSTNNTNSNDNNNNDTGIIMTTETKRRKLDPMGQKRPIQFWTTTTTTRTPPPLHGRQRSRIKMEYDDMYSPLDPDSIYSTTTSSGQTTTMYGLHNLNDNNCNNTTTTTTTTSVSIGPRTNSFGRDTWWMVDLDGADFRCCGDDCKNHHGNNTTFRVDSTTTTTTAATTTTTRATTMEEEEFITPVPPHRYQGATPLVWCCMKKFGWDEQYARRVLNGYRQYLSLIEQKGNDMAGTGTVDNTLSNLTQIYYPCCHDVDKMWQEHILDTTNYIHDCLLLCGRFVGRTRNLNDYYDNNNSNHHDNNNKNNNNNHDDDYDNGTTKSHVTRTSEERDQVTRAALKDLFKSRYDEALWLNQVVVSSTQQNDSKEIGLGEAHEQQQQLLPQEPYLVQPPEAEEEKEETTTREPLQNQIPLSPQLQKEQPLSMQPQTHEAPKDPQSSQDPPTQQQQQHTPQRSPPATEEEEEKTNQQQEPLKHTKEGKIDLYVLDRTTRDTNNKKNKKNNDEMEQDQDEEMVEAEYLFKTARTRPMSFIMNRFAESEGIPVTLLEFFTFGERQIHPNDTPLTLGLGDKDNIVVVSSSSSSL